MATVGLHNCFRAILIDNFIVYYGATHKSKLYMTKSAKNTKVNFSVVSGNLLEWYEFSLYGYMAGIFAEVFFPKEKNWSALLLVFSTYALSFALRPIGGLMLGYVGDRYGRKRVLLISIICLSILTLGIGLLPDYSAIGGLAAMLLIMLRLLQGIFISGEYVGACVYQSERYSKRPGFYAAFVQSSTFLGGLLASLSVLFLTLCFSKAAILNGAWRIPYLVAGALAIVIVFYRMRLPDKRLEKYSVASFFLTWKALLKSHKKTLLQAFLIPAAATSATYYFIYQLTYLTHFLGKRLSVSLFIMIASKLILFISLPFFANLGDKIGWKKFLTISLVLIILVSPVIFYLMTQKHLVDLILGQVLFALFISPYIALNMTYVTVLFPPSVKLTASTGCINLSIAIFGATTPLISLLLIKWTQYGFMPSIYFVFTCLLSLVALWSSKFPTRFHDLSQNKI